MHRNEECRGTKDMIFNVTVHSKQHLDVSFNCCRLLRSVEMFGVSGGPADFKNTYLGTSFPSRRACHSAHGNQVHRTTAIFSAVVPSLRPTHLRGHLLPLPYPIITYTGDTDLVDTHAVQLIQCGNGGRARWHTVRSVVSD